MPGESWARLHMDWDQPEIRSIGATPLLRKDKVDRLNSSYPEYSIMLQEVCLLNKTSG